MPVLRDNLGRAWALTATNVGQLTAAQTSGIAPPALILQASDDGSIWYLKISSSGVISTTVAPAGSQPNQVVVESPDLTRWDVEVQPDGTWVLSRLNVIPGVKHSWMTQRMMNYFDWTDTRTRKSEYSIENQLLNIAAGEIEDLTMRLDRELGRGLTNVATNIDNLGIYYMAPLPSNLQLSKAITSLSSVIGQVGTLQYTLPVYDDRLQVPQQLQFGKPMPLSDPVLFTMTGEGDARTRLFTPQSVEPGTLPVPNALTFWLDNEGLTLAVLDIYIEGQLYPQQAWVQQRESSVETLSFRGSGCFTTTNRWVSIDSIVVRGLPEGATLTCYSMPFNLPAVPDSQRPYIDPSLRDVNLNRYWQIDNEHGQLLEQYMDRGFAGLTYVNSYRLGETMVDLAVEPHTYGLLTVSGSTLYYFDRREPLPQDLTGPALTAEPCYGLFVNYDVTSDTYTRQVVLTPDPYAKASQVKQYRYVMTNPSGDLFVILPDGALVAYSGNVGWRAGLPVQVTVPLVEGEYQFRLECMANGVVTYDQMPYGNWTAQPRVSLSLAQLSNVAGCCFDSFGTFWIWTGTYAIPVKLIYYAYVLDAVNSRIYFTAPFDAVYVTP